MPSLAGSRARPPQRTWGFRAYLKMLRVTVVPNRVVWAVLDLYITHARTASGSTSSTANAYAESDTPEANQPPTSR